MSKRNGEIKKIVKESVEKILSSEKQNLLNNILFLSVNLDDKSKQKLQTFFTKNNKWKTNNIKMLCHHMTIAFHTNISDYVFDYTLENLNKIKELKVIGYGFSEKAFAVLIETDVLSTNLRKHITCAVNLDNNGKPVDSNSISNWKLLPKENVFNLNGCVTINYKNKRGV